MQEISYYEEDVVRIVDLGESKAYIFTFYPRDKILHMYDQGSGGESPDDFDVYTDTFDEICYLCDAECEPEWPIVVEYE